MFFIKTGGGIDSIVSLLPGVTAISILFGTTSMLSVTIASMLMDLGTVSWLMFLPAVLMIAVSSTFLGLFIAVAVREVFEAQSFSNFFRFPMVFLCGLFFPISQLPVFIRPLSYGLPLTYGVDVLHGAVYGGNMISYAIYLGLLGLFCVGLFAASLYNIKRKWIF